LGALDLDGRQRAAWSLLLRAAGGGGGGGGRRVGSALVGGGVRAEGDAPDGGLRAPDPFGVGVARGGASAQGGGGGAGECGWFLQAERCWSVLGGCSIDGWLRADDHDSACWPTRRKSTVKGAKGLRSSGANGVRIGLNRLIEDGWH